jgi:hypothetical protein
MDTNSDHISIHCIGCLDIPSRAAAFLVDLLVFLCSATLMASMFSRELADEGW